MPTNVPGIVSVCFNGRCFISCSHFLFVFSVEHICPRFIFIQCIVWIFTMRDTHLRSIDLNLLRTIQPLLEERHVSRAAKRSFLSQPAMSRALDRLRDAFGDPLLVRSGRGYERTPRGERVLREIEPIMRRLQAIVRDEEFTPG